jgi:hypothetical protein
MSIYEISPDMNIDDIVEGIRDNRLIIINSGVYNIMKSLVLYPNTRIILKPDATLKRSANVPVFTTKVLPSTTGYNGTNNVQIEGGIIDGNVKGVGFGNMTQFMHARGIIMDRVTFRDTNGSHAIEINSSKNVRILDCNILGYIPNKDGAYREAIQIDFANYSALTVVPSKSAQCYDNTHCEDIYISRCVFDKSEKYPAPINAIGAHTQSATDKKHQNIFIINNIGRGRGYYNGYGLFLSLINMKNVFVHGNQLSDYMRMARISVPTVFYTSDGTKVDKPTTLIGCENIEFANNQISNPTNQDKIIGVFVRSDTDGIRHKNISFIHETYIVPDDNIKASNIFAVKDTDGITFMDNLLKSKLKTPIAIGSECTDIINK